MSQPQTTEDTSRENLLGTAPIGRLLFSLAVPAITAQVVNMLYNIVDRIYIGHIQRSAQQPLPAWASPSPSSP